MVDMFFGNERTLFTVDLVRSLIIYATLVATPAALVRAFEVAQQTIIKRLLCYFMAKNAPSSYLARSPQLVPLLSCQAQILHRRACLVQQSSSISK